MEELLRSLVQHNVLDEVLRRQLLDVALSSAAVALAEDSGFSGLDDFREDLQAAQDPQPPGIASRLWSTTLKLFRAAGHLGCAMESPERGCCSKFSSEVDEAVKEMKRLAGRSKKLRPDGKAVVRRHNKPAVQATRRKAPVKTRDIGPAHGDADKWRFIQEDGFEIELTTKNTVEPIKVASKEEAIAMVKAKPDEYFGCSWVQHGYVGAGTARVYPRTCSFFGPGFAKSSQPDATGAMEAKYVALPEKVSVVPDAYTDGCLASYQKACHTSKSPGRGEGVVDKPGLKIIGDVDPSDIGQGHVGDCWLLSAISALSEFDGAIHRLFKNTSDIDNLPKAGFNRYTVTLCDLSTWSPVDVVVDERLLVRGEGVDLLGCKPSSDAELWPCILEKAVAAHCGGWDAIDGGTCTHAWRMLVGCKEVYTIRRGKDGRFSCLGAFNPNEKRWEDLTNSPHTSFRGLWPMDWPEVGGGGSFKDTYDENAVFEKMCHWDDNNFLVGAGSRSGSDTHQTDGIVDGHAYTVLTCLNDAGGTGFDMIKMRNPWGKGEFEGGGWTDGGPMWKEHPEVYKACGNPESRDDGIFWIEKEEFFKHFGTIYLCAKDMGEFLTD